MPSRARRALLATLAVAAVAAARPAAAQAPFAESHPSVIAAARKEGKLVIYSTTDTMAAQPLLKEFRERYPEIEVEYDDMSSSEVYSRFVSDAAAGAPSADLLWSSSMDLQIRIAAEGRAAEYASPAAKHLPPWAVWRDLAYGTTFEPLGFAYNKRLLGDAPQSHADLVRAIQRDPARWQGKVCSYDPERSGLGFLLITRDEKADPAFDAALDAYGTAQVKLYTSTSAMLDKIQSGEHLLGFNMLGSYVLARAKKDSNIGFVLPRDYALVISRVALLPRTSRHPNAGRLFLDFLLSQRGQEIMAGRAHLFAIRLGVSGDYTAGGLEKQGGALRPVPMSDELLQMLDPSRRQAFLRRWRNAISGRGSEGE